MVGAINPSRESLVSVYRDPTDEYLLAALNSGTLAATAWDVETLP